MGGGSGVRPQSNQNLPSSESSWRSALSRPRHCSPLQWQTPVRSRAADNPGNRDSIVAILPGQWWTTQDTAFAEAPFCEGGRATAAGNTTPDLPWGIPLDSWGILHSTCSRGLPSALEASSRGQPGRAGSVRSETSVARVIAHVSPVLPHRVYEDTVGNVTLKRARRDSRPLEFQQRFVRGHRRPTAHHAPSLPLITCILHFPQETLFTGFGTHPRAFSLHRC